MQADGLKFERAKLSLNGLSVGDAFGQRYFLDEAVVEQLIESRALAAPPWRFTDDTMMALSIVLNLYQYGRIDQDRLAKCFGEHYDFTRGYGPAMHSLLYRYQCGERWRDAAPSLFAGQGSYGNGSAMRVAPIGAYFADDIDAVVDNAARSSEVTHAHSEAIAGAIAVAVAAAWAYRLRAEQRLPSSAEFLDLILPAIPRSEVSGKVRKARDMSPNSSLAFAVSVLGNGSEISAQDTVPISLWCASKHLDNYTEALWLMVSAYGDRDTTCAIVGGIVAMYSDIPAEWLNSREQLLDWFLKGTDKQ